jgi:hypothetical protein
MTIAEKKKTPIRRRFRAREFLDSVAISISRRIRGLG